MRPYVSVVVPTFREAENLRELVCRIGRALTKADILGEVIIVDDNSGDGTIDICASLRSDYPVRLETRYDERGLATAVLHGLRRARGQLLVVMDADLSHPPEAIPKLIEAVRAGADMVVGSRYAEGGEIEADWGVLRWLNSKLATLLARPLTKINDPMAGFFAIHKNTLARAERLDPIGYKIGLELLVKCHCRSVVEIPIRFIDRRRGQSKLNFREQRNYIAHLFRLYAFKLGLLKRPLRVKPAFAQSDSHDSF